MIPVIYGWGKDFKKVAYAGIEKCPHCKNYGHFYIAELTSFAKLYFIKVAKWNKKFCFFCGACERGFELEADKKDQIIRATIQLPSAQEAQELWRHFDRELNAALAAVGEKQTDEIRDLLVKTLQETATKLRRLLQPEYVDYVCSRYVAYLM